MTFEIKVNGQNFELWETASLKRSIDTNTGVFRFTSSTEEMGSYPIQQEDSIQIILNGRCMLTGFVDAINVNGDSRNHIITVQGRDNTADLIDSSVPDAAKQINTPISVADFCTNVITSLGANINVIDTVGDLITPFSDDVQISADSGKKCMEYLVDFARKRQVYLIPDGLGSLAVFRPNEAALSGTRLIHRRNDPQNNIKKYNFTSNNSQRYNTYRITSQDNFSFPSSDYTGDGDQNGVDRSGNATDEQIRASRYLEFQGEETMPTDETVDRAEEESNIRRARAFQYEATVQGITQNNGDLWDIGIRVPIEDQINGVQGIYLIRQVEYTSDLDSGTETKLVFARPESYSVRGSITRQDRRIAPTENNYQPETPQTMPTFTRGDS